MGAIFSSPQSVGAPPPPPPPPPAANPPVYADAKMQGNARRARASGSVPGFGDTVKTDAFGGPQPTTELKQLMGA